MLLHVTVMDDALTELNANVVGAFTNVTVDATSVDVLVPIRASTV